MNSKIKRYFWNILIAFDQGVNALRCNQTTITSLSDERDKTEIIDLGYGLDYINQLRPVEFKWDYREEHDHIIEATEEAEEKRVRPFKQGKKEVGFIAQELKTVQDSFSAESLKSYSHSPADVEGKGSQKLDILEASSGRLIPVLVKAIQDLSKEIEDLKAQINP